MTRKNVMLPISNEHLHAEVIDGEVVGFQPISIIHLNSDIDTCIKYLETIKEAMEATNGQRRTSQAGQLRAQGA